MFVAGQRLQLMDGAGGVVVSRLLTGSGAKAEVEGAGRTVCWFVVFIMGTASGGKAAYECAGRIVWRSADDVCVGATTTKDGELLLVGLSCLLTASSGREASAVSSRVSRSFVEDVRMR